MDQPDIMSAAKAAACGDAMLVPVMVKPPAVMSVPGATISGLALPSSVFTKEDEPLMVSMESS